MATAASLLAGYASPGQQFDELVGADGAVRSDWRYLTEALAALGPDGLKARSADVQRLLIEHGVTYNIYGQKPEAVARWALDLVPMLIPSRQWREIEVGIAQRAELLRQILSDIYGPQQLIARGLLPADLIYGHPGYLMPCHGIDQPPEHALMLYAADFARGPDGKFYVTGDRTQAPSGIGYALKARAITSRVLPSVFRESSVHPILPFVRALRRTLVELADNEPGAIALLTPGPANETYSEHVFLAHQLGIALVEGGDLDVINGRAYIDQGGDRIPLRVILRRLDDDYCDPLELNRKSLLGSAGLLQAARNRQLRLVNPLGSGLLENPALMAFLPAVCRDLLGEELKLPSIATWWGGRPDELAHIEANFDDMVIRSVRQSARAPAVAPAQLAAEKRRNLLQRIRERPGSFVAQRLHAQATAPVLDGSALAPRPVELRTFAVASGSSFNVMSGGLARAGQSTDSWRVSGQLGGVSKDLWVLSSEAQPEPQNLPLFASETERTLRSMPPVAVEDLLWFGRYAARTETLARLLRKTLAKLLVDDREPQNDHELTVMLQAITWQTTVYPGFIGPLGEPNLAAPAPELLRAIAGTNAAGSLAHDLAALRSAAAPVRDLLSDALWLQINRLAAEINAPQSLAEAAHQVEQAELRCIAVNGLIARGLPLRAARDVVRVGTLIESMIGAARLTRSLLVGADMAPALVDLLDLIVVDALDDGKHPMVPVLRELLTERERPQSMQRQLGSVARRIERLPLPPQRASHDISGLEQRVAALQAQLSAIDLVALANDRGPAGALDTLLESLDHELQSVAAELDALYTRRRPPQAQLVATA